MGKKIVHYRPCNKSTGHIRERFNMSGQKKPGTLAGLRAPGRSIIHLPGVIPGSAKKYFFGVAHFSMIEIEPSVFLLIETALIQQESISLLAQWSKSHSIGFLALTIT